MTDEYVLRRPLANKPAHYYRKLSAAVFHTSVCGREVSVAEVIESAESVCGLCEKTVKERKP